MDFFSKVKSAVMTSAKPDNVKAVWEAWGDIHSSKDQLNRIAKAKLAENTPLSVNQKQRTAIFSGSSKYHTTVQSCNCVDFQRRKLPCKHMYRLFIEIGCLDETAVTDTKAIITAKDERMTLSDAIDKLEALDDETQKEYLDYSASTCNMKSKKLFMKATLGVQKLLDAGLLVCVSDELGVKSVGTIEVMRSSNLIGIQQKLHSYLKRKYDTDDYYDPDTNDFITMPHGTEDKISICIGNSGVEFSPVESSFPNDELTFFLKKYGHA